MLSASSGPLLIYGKARALMGALGGPVPDSNQDAGPSGLGQGFGYPDQRLLYQDEQVSGRTGVLAMLLAQAAIQSANVIPAAFGTATIAALANAVSGTAMTVVGTNTIAAAKGIPIAPFSQGWQAQPVVNAALVLDFGFAFATGTLNSVTWTVADSTQWPIGMPIVIAGAGGAVGTPLLTWVAGQTDATHITTQDACLRAVTAAPVGAGNLWMPREGFSTLEPTGHVPFIASGVGAFLDPSQALARCVSVTGGTAATGNAAGILVSGWDVYWQPMSELIVAPAAASTNFGKKAFKAIASAVPQFSEAHPYSIGTGDTFGFAFRCNAWEDTTICWAGALNAANTGFVAADNTSPATTTTGDVRGTIQVSGQGNGGGGIGTTNSNGTVSSLARAGNRLMMAQMPGIRGLLWGTPFAPAYAYGQTQA